MVEKFLIDSNSFVTPYRQYYAFDLVPAYWKEISKCANSGRLVLLDMVKAEIDKGEDDLVDCSGCSKWLYNYYGRSTIRWLECKESE